jgi:HAE1 family hydrophobic/amphiphilic exporter-1
MLVVSLTVVGIYSFFGLGVDFFPNIDIPTVAISVSNPGASAEQIETEITKKIEGAVNTISGIDELHSTSMEGQSQVVIQFVLDKNGDVAAQEVRDKVNLVVGDLPDTARAPVILKADPGAIPIMQMAVAGARPLREITQFADKEIKQRLESIDGVGQVQLVGGADREIQVRLDPDKMRSFGITVADVTNALRQQNLTLPAGRVDQGPRELTLRTMGKVTEPAQFNMIAVANRGDYVVRLGDLGDAVDTHAELRTASFLNGNPAVTLVVTKQSGQNTVTVARAVKERLAQITATLPPDIHTHIVDDQSLFTEASIRAIEEHLILGSVLASVVIFFFLSNIRTTLIAAVAIPTSIISTFALMKAMGYTLNQVTMLALTLMVGVVIDDAIIVLENIYRFIEEKGMPPFEAAIKGTKEIGLAVMATTMSLLAVFVPVAFMGGIVGRFLSSFSLTAAFAVGVSLLVSFTLTPMLSSRFIKPPTGDPARRHASRDSAIFRPIDRAYVAMLRWSMAHRLTVVMACVLVTASIVPLFIKIGKDFAPDEDRSQFLLTVRTPEGSGLAATTTIVERIAADLRLQPGVADTLVTIGGGVQNGPTPGLGSVNSGTITVGLVPPEARTFSQGQMIDKTRTLVRHYPGNLRTAVQSTGGPGGGPGAQFSVRGPDLERLGHYTDELVQRVSQSPVAVDVDSSLIYGKPELRVRIDRQRAADLGVRVQDIAQALSTLVGGTKVTTFDVGEDQYDVTVRAAERYRTSVEGLERMTVASSKRGTVTIGEVVDIVPTTGPSAIERLNRQRQVTLSANVAPGGSQEALVTAIQQAAADLHLPREYTAQPAGQSVELARTASSFLTAVSLSFVFMYIILAAQFESFVHPITILLTLPLAIPFGLLSLFVAGQTVNLFAGLGLLLLFGIVKKNAILQIDHTNGLRAAGHSRDDAIMQANRERLRPILMTTIALVAGMIPLVTSGGAGSASNRSIGILVVGGQTLCLLLTLLAVPVFYSLFDDLESWPAWAGIAHAWERMAHALARPVDRERHDTPEFKGPPPARPVIAEEPGE